MRSSGLVRKIDDLGRIVLPAEIRRTLGLRTHDSLEISMDGELIALRKHEKTCVLCGNTGDMVPFLNKSVCSACIGSIKTMGA